MFLRQLTEEHDIKDSLFLLDDVQHLTALRRAGHRDRNSAEHVFRELKRRYARVHQNLQQRPS